MKEKKMTKSQLQSNNVTNQKHSSAPILTASPLRDSAPAAASPGTTANIAVAHKITVSGIIDISI